MPKCNKIHHHFYYATLMDSTDDTAFPKDDENSDTFISICHANGGDVRTVIDNGDASDLLDEVSN
jgi:hypothetical protein